MSLHAIVETLGGHLYDGGRRAFVRAPGHSAADRSVSLMLSAGRVIFHSFGSSDWREVRGLLRELGLLDGDDRPVGSVSGVGPLTTSRPRPDKRRRVETARRLWAGAELIQPGCASYRHLVGRVGPERGTWPDALRHHPSAPVSVFNPGSRAHPALLASVCDLEGEVTAVEIVYLSPNGRRTDAVRLSRKTAGVMPAGAAVRLHAVASDMLVGEGVMTVLSASRRFGLPGWACLSARSLSTWSPPAGVRSVLIAGDRGKTGEEAASMLADRLRQLGVSSRIALPPAGFGDWNDASEPGRRREEGTEQAPA